MRYVLSLNRLMVINRWKYDSEMREFKLSNWSWLKLTIARWFVNSQTHQQGLGRHNKEEVMAILNKDFHSLSTYLGKFYFPYFIFTVIFLKHVCQVDIFIITLHGCFIMNLFF